MRPDHPAYAEWAGRSLITNSGPAHITIHSTGTCNFSCFMCWHRYVDDMGVTIESEKLDPFLQSAEFVALAGGEPFWITENVNGRGKEIVDRIISRHPRPKLIAYTNGALLKDEMAELALSRFFSVNFSIDTLDPALYEKIRGKPVLDRVMANLEGLNELKMRKGLGRDDPPFINVNSIVMDATLDGLPEITKWFAQHGGHSHLFVKLQDIFDPAFDYVGVKRRLQESASTAEVETAVSAHHKTYERSKLKDDPPTVKRVEHTVKRLQERAASTGILLEDKSNILGINERHAPPEDGRDAVCPQPWMTAYIHQNGDVFCCCTNSIVLGNLGRDSFDEIWNGEAARELRASFIKGEMKGCVEKACESYMDYFSVPPKRQLTAKEIS